MNKQAHAAGSSFRLSLWWAWVPLLPLLAGGCNKLPPDLACGDSERFFQADAQQGAGAAPFSIERPGREVRLEVLERYPDGIRLRAADNRAAVDWRILGHSDKYSLVTYSPSEGLARNADNPDDAVPMRVFFDGASVRARLGFGSRACPDLDSDAPSCELGNDMRLFVAEMTCKRTRVELPLY